MALSTHHDKDANKSHWQLILFILSLTQQCTFTLQGSQDLCNNSTIPQPFLIIYVVCYSTIYGSTTSAFTVFNWSSCIVKQLWELTVYSHSEIKCILFKVFHTGIRCFHPVMLFNCCAITYYLNNLASSPLL